MARAEQTAGASCVGTLGAWGIYYFWIATDDEDFVKERALDTFLISAHGELHETSARFHMKIASGTRESDTAGKTGQVDCLGRSAPDDEMDGCSSFR